MNYLSAVLREEEAQLAKKVLLEYEEKLRNVELIDGRRIQKKQTILRSENV